MLNRIKNQNVLNFIIFIMLVSAVIIYAHENGIVERTMKNGDGCTCHSESPSVNVLVTISGPDTLAVGQSATYTVTIQGGPLESGGINVAASEGNLDPISGDLRKESNELTHVSPKLPSSGSVTFQFNYNSPNSTGQQILFANGNSVNLNGENSGDQWNFAANKIINVIQPTGVDDQILVNSFELLQNYPNPFNPTTKISWQSPMGRQQILKIYDVLGNEVAIIVNEWKEPGKHSVEFNATGLSSGIYYYQLTAGDFIGIRKMILAK
ncbi:hypothetical protein LDC_1189 [sediment metagenome]|uniref:Secretion system C-terminal sorting domain-containing protein n=1 Tax=sediment metagenome TaxID=749907 RepID=D9PI35_9ZZZZ